MPHPRRLLQLLQGLQGRLLPSAFCETHSALEDSITGRDTKRAVFDDPSTETHRTLLSKVNFLGRRRDHVSVTSARVWLHSRSTSSLATWLLVPFLPTILGYSFDVDFSSCLSKPTTMVKTNNDLAESEATLNDFRGTEKSTPPLSVQAPGASILAIANDTSQLANIVGEDGEETQLQAETAQSPEVAPRADLPHPRTMQTAVVILTLTAITATSSMSTGLVTIGIPHIAQDLRLPESIILWLACPYPGTINLCMSTLSSLLGQVPYTRKHGRSIDYCQSWSLSIHRLANGCCLLLAGSVADMIGNRNINLAGSLMLAVLIAISGVARTGVQFILFRALQGVGASMFFPTSISILATAVPSGRARNVGFGCLGFAQPVGLQVGLLLSGVFENAPVTWRFGFYLCAGVTMVFFATACWFLPKDRPRETLTWTRLIYRIDWLGIFISSTSFGLLSYVLAYVLLSRTYICLTELTEKSEVTGSVSKIHDAANITLLSISAVLAPLFIFWMHRQESRGNVALIPNSLWKNKMFSTTCFMVVICWAVANSMDWFFSLL